MFPLQLFLLIRFLAYIPFLVRKVSVQFLSAINGQPRSVAIPVSSHSTELLIKFLCFFFSFNFSSEPNYNKSLLIRIFIYIPIQYEYTEKAQCVECFIEAKPDTQVQRGPRSLGIRQRSEVDILQQTWQHLEHDLAILQITNNGAHIEYLKRFSLQ